MSANGETSVVLRGITHGAVDYLLKPVRIEELRNIWQHVVRRRREGSGGPPGSKEDASEERPASATRAEKAGGRKEKSKRKEGDVGGEYAEVRRPAIAARRGGAPQPQALDPLARFLAHTRSRRTARSPRSRAWCGPWSCTTSSSTQSTAWASTKPCPSASWTSWASQASRAKTWPATCRSTGE